MLSESTRFGVPQHDKLVDFGKALIQLPRFLTIALRQVDLLLTASWHLVYGSPGKRVGLQNEYTRASMIYGKNTLPVVVVEGRLARPRQVYNGMGALLRWFYS